MEPGRPQRVDDAYERQGCCDLFLIVHPLTGWRDVHVTERRTKEDFARQMKWLVDDVVPEAEGIRVVLDNRNTHTPAVLYQTFPPAEARRLTRDVGVSRSAEAWQLAEHDRDRVLHPGAPMSGSASAG
jgi:hypothetical protein